MIIKPLPPWQHPIATFNGAAQKEFYDWLQSVDASLRGVAPNDQTANYVLVINDAGGIVETNVAGANTLTVPPSVSVAFGLSTTVTIAQIGAGQTTLTPGVGVTLRSRVGLKLAGQYAVARIYKRATDEWVASGDLTP